MSPADALRRGPLPIHGSDLRGLVRLGVDGALGVTDLVEAMHHTIASRTGILGQAPQGRTAGLTGLVYRSVRGTTRVLGQGADTLLAGLTRPAGASASAPRREAVIAALNGLWGDHLADSGNPLAITMSLRVAGRPLELSAAALSAHPPATGGKLLVLVHGLCMNDLQWARKGHDHGLALARELGYTALYLHYNSGRHVSQNGQEFAALLEDLVARWPVPVDEIAIVGHSMGGLVARSACHHAGQGGLRWLARLRKIVFLGTPHQGAPLERGGRWVDVMLGLSPYLAPFARLGKSRSAGITDLRYGNLQHADWQGRDRHRQRRDDRLPTPLPSGVRAYAVAATTAEQAGGPRDGVIGDGLVPLASALGEHRDAALALALPIGQRRVVTSASHWDLLDRAEVCTQLCEWLGEDG